MTGCIADKFHQDPRIAQAKALILEALNEVQTQFDGVRPPLTDTKVSYEELLERLGEARGGRTYFPYIGSGLGRGPLVELLDGSVKYDFITGIGVHFFGHSHPELMSVAVDAAIGNTIMQGHLQQNAETLELAEIFIQASGLDHCFITSSGAMANENALKLAFHKGHPRHRLIALENCFMGRTWALSQLTDRPKYRMGLPNNVQVDYVPFFDSLDPEGSTQRAINTLNKHFARHPHQHAAMFFELVQGEGGFYPGSHDYFVALMDLCRRHGVAVVADEVQTFGRLPEMFAFKYFGLDDYVDIVTVGKLTQVCATLFRSDFKPKPGLLSQTFTASTSAIRAAIYILKYLQENAFYGPNGRIVEIQERFRQCVDAIAERHPHWIEGPYGIGAMTAFTPFGGEPEAVTRFTHNLYEAGVISFLAGGAPARARFLMPAAAVTDEDIDAVCDIIEKTLVKTAEELKIPSHEM